LTWLDVHKHDAWYVTVQQHACEYARFAVPRLFLQFKVAVTYACLQDPSEDIAYMIALVQQHKEKLLKDHDSAAAVLQVRICAAACVPCTVLLCLHGML